MKILKIEMEFKILLDKIILEYKLIHENLIIFVILYILQILKKI